MMQEMFTDPRENQMLMRKAQARYMTLANLAFFVAGVMVAALCFVLAAASGF